MILSDKYHTELRDDMIISISKVESKDKDLNHKIKIMTCGGLLCLQYEDKASFETDYKRLSSMLGII